MGEARPVTTTPTTQAATDNGRPAYNRAFGMLMGYLPVAEDGDSARALLDAIEAEARDATGLATNQLPEPTKLVVTGLREALDAADAAVTQYDAMVILRAAVCAALAAAPQANE